MTSSTSSSRILPALAAVLGPLLVLAGAGWTFAQREEGQLSRVAARMEAALASAPPDMVFVGNSTAPRVMKRDVLARVLDLPDLVLTDLSVPGSGAATWYAVLKHRVYANGWAPRVVLIPSLYEHMISVGSFGDDARITNQLLEDDPVILRKTFQVSASHPWLFHMEQGRDRLRQRALDGLRDWSVGLFWGHGEKPAEQVASEALTQVFSAEGAVDLTLHRRAVPIVEAERSQVGDAGAVSLGDSYLPDIVRMAQDGGAKVVFILLPTSTNDHRYKSVDPMRKQELVKLLNELGAGWMDFTGQVPDSSFSDALHINSVGGKALAEEIGRGLLEMGALEDGPLRPALLPVVASQVERTGTAPTFTPGPPKRGKDSPCAWSSPFPMIERVGVHLLPALGLAGANPMVLRIHGRDLGAGTRPGEEGCDGSWALQGRGALKQTLLFSPWEEPVEGQAPAGVEVGFSDQVPLLSNKNRRVWWVYPGTTLRVQVQGRWTPEMGPFLAESVALAMTREPGRATLRVGDGPAVTFEGPSLWVKARLQAAPPPGESWTLEIASPADGPFLLVRTVTLGEEGASTPLLGSPTDGQGPRFDLVRPAEDNPNVTWEVSSTVPTVEQGSIVRKGRLASIPLGGIGALTSQELSSHVGDLDCDPLRLAVDGLPGAKGAVACSRVRRLKEGSWCREKGHAVFPAPKPGDTAVRSLVVDPQRHCVGYKGRWLYPGDVMGLAFQKAGGIMGYDQVTVRGAAVPGVGEARPLSLRVSVGDAVLLDTSVAVADLARGITWDLPFRLPTEGLTGRVEISNPADGAWVVLNQVSLLEGRRFQDLPALAAPDRSDALDIVAGFKVEVGTTRSAGSDTPLPLVVVLHGAGGRPNVKTLLRSPTELRAVAPQGPLVHDTGFAWFNYSKDPAEEPRVSQEMGAMAEKVYAFVTEARDRWPTRGRPILVGTSQGACLALAVAALHPDQVSHVVAISGYLPPSLWKPPPRGVSLPSIEAFNGARDRIVPIEGARATVQRFQEAGYPVAFHEDPEANHRLPDLWSTYLPAFAEKVSAVR